MALEGSPLPSHQRDLDGLKGDQWQQRATEWIYGLRARTHSIDGMLTELRADITAIRDDATRTEHSLNKIGDDMESVKNDTHELKGVVGFLKWAIPVAIAFSGVLVAVTEKILRKSG